MRGARTWVCLTAFAVGGCGAKTDLAVDASARDGSPVVDAAPDGLDGDSPVRPDCLVALTAGEVRGTLDDISGRVVFDPDGWLYGLRLVDGALTLNRWDPCLREEWSVALPLEGSGPDAARIARAVDGDLFVFAMLEIARVNVDGEVLPLGLDFEGQLLFNFVAAAPFPVLATTTPGEDPVMLRAFGPGGTLATALHTPSSYVWEDECLVASATVACWDVAYALGDLSDLWFHASPQLLDGTLRHVLPPASDGERVYGVLFGISTYEVAAVDLRTGEQAWRTSVARSTLGQTDLLVGGPILVEDRLVTYLSTHRESGPDGQLEAFDLDGERIWSYPAARTSTAREIFDTDATHVAGDAGLVYLATGETLHAVGVETGEGRWAVSLGVGVNEPRLNISPLGDLALRTDDGDVLVVATESLGPARSAWPVPFHDPMATNGL
jgi:hypothetical protein